MIDYRSFEITDYQYGFLNDDKSQGKHMVAYLYQKDKRIATVFFQDNPKAPHTNKNGQLCLYYRIEDLLAIVDMLRNENPVYLHINDSPQYNQALLTTAKEPVGEGE